MAERAVSDHQKSSRASAVFMTLKNRILQWKYPPGHRFTEEEICREFGVSRSPVRETLRMLEENGLVDKVPYRGCTVKQPNLREINELYDVRIMLELAIVEHLAANRLPQDDYAHLYQTWEELSRVTASSVIDGAELAQFDRTFHESLAQATGNRTLHDLLHTINDRLHFIRMTDITTVERLWDTCQQHLRILECIRAADSAAAKAAMHANIEGARAHVKTAIKEVIAAAYIAAAD